MTRSTAFLVVVAVVAALAGVLLGEPYDSIGDWLFVGIPLLILAVGYLLRLLVRQRSGNPATKDGRKR
jgi:hypothetical protein